jgi:hypothetical protein
MENAKQIAKLNDAYRQQGRVVFTRGVIELEDLQGLLAAVRLFDIFTEANDPHHEHDFGSLVWHGEKIFWKLDYAVAEMPARSDDHAGERILSRFAVTRESHGFRVFCWQHSIEHLKMDAQMPIP